MKKKVFLRPIPWTCSALPTRISRRTSENRWKVSSTPMAGVTKESEVFHGETHSCGSDQFGVETRDGERSSSAYPRGRCGKERRGVFGGRRSRSPLLAE